MPAMETATPAPAPASDPPPASDPAATADPAAADKPADPPADPPQRHLLFCGSSKWDMLGRKSLPRSAVQRGATASGDDFLAPTRFVLTDLPAPATTLRAVRSGPNAAHLVLLTADGRAFGLGRNDSAQLACADPRARSSPIQLAPPIGADGAPRRVVEAACGRAHTLLVCDDGSAWGAGVNNFGQIGCGTVCDARDKQSETTLQRVALPDDERATAVAAGADFSIFLCASGRVFAAGSGQYGHLGNGRTGECIEARNRIAFDVVPKPKQVLFDRVSGGSPNYVPPSDAAPDAADKELRITQVAAGTNHTLALDELGKVWSWGFGGYGRLGHRGPKDELRPRRIEMFEADHYKIDFIAAGQTCSYAVQRNRKSTYFWGITKKSQESNMYPKPIMDMQGWEVRSLAAGPTSTVAAAETSVISWGASPTFGELGYGPDQPKSSPKPKMVDMVDGLTCVDVAEGMAFTALLVEADGDAERKTLDALETHDLHGVEVPTGGKRKADGDGNADKGGKGRKKKRKAR